MMASSSRVTLSLLLGTLATIVGTVHCGSSTGAGEDVPKDTPTEQAEDDAGLGTDPGSNEAPDPSGEFGQDSGPSEPSGEIVKEVFGHSPDTLYKVDPVTKAITVIGKFDGCGGGVIDIAVDADSNIFGDTYTGLFKIDKTTAKCTSLTTSSGGGQFPDSLSFVPKGTLDANDEALVGYTGSNYLRIDLKTGAMTTVGSLSAGSLVSSGDIVSIKDGPTYLTVKPPMLGCIGDAECSKCMGGDCLVEVDPKTGKMLKNLGKLPHKDVFGLAYWGGLAYGFSNDGHLFEVSFADPGKLATTELSIPNKPDGLQFWGAASSTMSPVKPPVN